MLDERGDEVLASLLAITDDVDSRLLLLLQSQTQSVLLALDQLRILQFPR